jgi:hypothetical protein
LEFPRNRTMQCKYRRQPYPALVNPPPISVEFPQELRWPACKSTDTGFVAKSCVRWRAGNQRDARCVGCAPTIATKPVRATGLPTRRRGEWPARAQSTLNKTAVPQFR